MAQKRMFDKRITDSDRFTDLPNSSKALYFMAGMSADDRGFFQPKRLQKMCGFTDDDFKVLIAKQFIIPFDSGVMVITDWNKNNWLDKRRITETEYIDELNLLSLINERYELNNTCLASAKPMLSQYSIEENSIEENSINIYEQQFDEIWKLYPNKKGKATALKSFTKAIKEGISANVIKQGVINYVNYIEIEHIKPQYIKHGSTWFNQRCWDDDYETKQNNPNWFDNKNDIQEMTQEERLEFDKILEELE